MLKYLRRRIPVPEIYFELYPKWDGLIVRQVQFLTFATTDTLSMN